MFIIKSTYEFLRQACEDNARVLFLFVVIEKLMFISLVQVSDAPVFEV